MIRMIVGSALIVLGIAPGLKWAWMMFYMIAIMGPRGGWLTDAFLDYEGKSFFWCAAMFAGIGLAALGSSIGGSGIDSWARKIGRSR